MGLSRRAFLFGISASAGGMMVLPVWFAEAATPRPIPGRELTAWVEIRDDDTVVIKVARSEMGQGIFTALPMLVAEELGCEWTKVRPEYVEVAEHLARNRAWGPMVTTDSVSVRTSQEFLRRAGAQAREMLIAEAAARWDVPLSECKASAGVVTHFQSGRSARYGELAEGASQRPVPAEVQLKRPEQWTLIGRSVAQVDLCAKVTGQPIYASDVRLPGLLHAAIRACPAHGGKLARFDADAALRRPGVRHVVAVGDDAVAVVATTWWEAHRALEAVTITWDESRAAGMSTDRLLQGLVDGLDGPDAAIARRSGNVQQALAAAAHRVDADYRVPYLAHATMEPQTCTASVVDGRAEVWAPTQNGEGTAAAVARTLGIGVDRVIVHKCHLGGGFGRRGLTQDWASQAVLIAKAVGAPVKLLWSREEDFRRDFYRPMVAARMSAGLDAKGTLVAWKVSLCGASIAARLAPQWLRNGQDFGAMNGFHEHDMRYEVANFEVGYVMRNDGPPAGFWRGVNYSQNGFFREAFLDEVAHAAGQDPYLFRRAMLVNAPRSLAVLDEAARRANWGRAPAGVGQGIAVVEFDDAVCAQVAEVAVGSSGSLEVRRIVCVVDPVYVVHPDLVVAQMEGSIIQALGAALSGAITLRDGHVEQSNFHDQPLLRITECPAIETYLLPSGPRGGSRWGGIGETGVPPLAPALVNAVFAATGRRIRSLPLKDSPLAKKA